MPVYEYQCKSCGHVCDALQKLADAPLRECPACGKGALERLVSTPAFTVKGKGKGQTATRTRVGHNLDGGAAHSHDQGHSHSHGGHGHSHGPGCGHKH